MTALAGLVTFDSRSPEVRDCERMLKAQQRYAQEPGRTATSRGAAMGRAIFRLLPEDAFDRGPLFDAATGRILVADIRIDNRRDMADALGLSQKEAGARSDTDLLGRALERWGTGALDRIVGDFAFAWWDAPRRELTLARDYRGQRPIHYYCDGAFFAFASMPSGLHALPEVPFAVDEDAVARFLALMSEYDADTFYKGIHKVPPGHVAVISAAGISMRRYWSAPHSPLRYTGRGDYEEALRECLDTAVAARLRGARPQVGAHLSGGLDSSTVTATAARLLNEQGSVVAYTATPREGYDGGTLGDSIADEWALAAKVAQLYPSIEHVRIRSSGRPPTELLDKYFHFYQRPYLNICNGVWAHEILDDARSRGLRVILTGIGGNGSFSYDGIAGLSAMLSSGEIFNFARTTWGLTRRGMRWGTIAAQCLGPYLPSQAWHLVKRFRKRGATLSDYTTLNPAAASKLEAAFSTFDAALQPTADPQEARRRLVEFADHGNYNKGALGGWGIDYRDPTADKRLVELCLSIPAEAFLGPLPRDLARRAFADRLPIEVREERRKGYQAADWHEGFAASAPQLRDEIRRLAGTPGAADLLDVPKMERLLGAWPTDGWNTPGIVEAYRCALLRGVSAGHFIRRSKGTNA